MAVKIAVVDVLAGESGWFGRDPRLELLDSVLSDVEMLSTHATAPRLKV